MNTKKRNVVPFNLLNKILCPEKNSISLTFKFFTKLSCNEMVYLKVHLHTTLTLSEKLVVTALTEICHKLVVTALTEICDKLVVTALAAICALT